MALQIGSKVWLYEGYTRGNIREELTVTGETTRSWLVENGGRDVIKVPKNHQGTSMHIKTNYGGGKTLWLDRNAMERSDWVSLNRYKIFRIVEGMNDYDSLKKVADAIGYTEQVAGKEAELTAGSADHED